MPVTETENTIIFILIFKYIAISLTKHLNGSLLTAMIINNPTLQFIIIIMIIFYSSLYPYTNCYCSFQDTQAAAAALTSLGHVYTAIGDYPNALASHKQCVQLVKQMGDRLQEAREIGNVGAVYLAMGEFDSAVDCHTQHLRLARRLGDQVKTHVFYKTMDPNREVDFMTSEKTSRTLFTYC